MTPNLKAQHVCTETCRSNWKRHRKPLPWDHNYVDPQWCEEHLRWESRVDREKEEAAR